MIRELLGNRFGGRVGGSCQTSEHKRNGVNMMVSLISLIPPQAYGGRKTLGVPWDEYLILIGI